ncbi:MAG TPA: DUF742 domain-containing protein [Amycolatopsis sp.]|nr:DUF742 domain-containing protein [Amycolatopsis sp.]
MTTGPGGGAPPPDEDDEATFADVLNAFTLDSGRGRRKRRKPSDNQADAAPPQQTGGRPPGAFPPPVQQSMAPPPAAPPEPPGFFEPVHGTGLFEPAVSNAGPADYDDFGSGFSDFGDRSSLGEETAVVRPYALTGGRTKANLKLELETLVSVSDLAAARMDIMAVQFEHRAIMEECRTPRSVAEIAALLRVPLGVARVLISDAAGAGLITVHETVSGNENAEAHLMLMERVLSGLRRL